MDSAAGPEPTTRPAATLASATQLQEIHKLPTGFRAVSAKMRLRVLLVGKPLLRQRIRGHEAIDFFGRYLVRSCGIQAKHLAAQLRCNLRVTMALLELG